MATTEFAAKKSKPKEKSYKLADSGDMVPHLYQRIGEHRYPFFNSTTMNQDYVWDLRAQRKQAGLTQKDCAHLLDMAPTSYHKIETGVNWPKPDEIALLLIIHGMLFEHLFISLVHQGYEMIAGQLDTLPQLVDPLLLENENRLTSLKRLSARVAAYDRNGDAA